MIILAHLWHQIYWTWRPLLLVREKSVELWARKRKFPLPLQESRRGCYAGGSESLLASVTHAAVRAPLGVYYFPPFVASALSTLKYLDTREVLCAVR